MRNFYEIDTFLQRVSFPEHSLTDKKLFPWETPAICNQLSVVPQLKTHIKTLMAPKSLKSKRHR